jgi:hypothetical protein
VKGRLSCCANLLVFLLPGSLAAQSAAPGSADVQRVVIVKLDGVPQDVLERELDRVDPATQKSVLPWMDHVFVQRGTRLANFYVRAISLSAPSWSLLDTGQHLQIHGNVEFDRYTFHAYDYLNFFPFYLGYALDRQVDMPGVELLDNLGIPLLIDRFPYQERFQSFQLYQRGVRWQTFSEGLQHRLSHSLRELLDEWTIGFEIGSSVEEQTEHELIERLADPRIRYLDYFTGDFDHLAHSTPDAAAQRLALQRIDALLGRIWTAIEASPLAAHTALAVVSDHGMNTQPGVFSQGYNLVQFFTSRAGGGHHVVTNRHPLDEYKLKGLDPFVSEVITPSDNSAYLKGASKEYPTALLDLDGNERASVYLRNSALNALQILLEELKRPGLSPALRHAVVAAIFQIIAQHRAQWQSTLEELRAELAALRRRIEERQIQINAQPKKWTRAEWEQGLDKAARRLVVQQQTWRGQEHDYSAYADEFSKLLALIPADFDGHKLAAGDLIPKHAMGDANTIEELRNYVVGPGPEGMVVTPDGVLDMARSFQRIDYFPVLTSLAVRNNVQSAVGARPVDFIALRIPKAALPAGRDVSGDADAVWLYGGEDRQAIIFSRDTNGTLELRYQPVRGVNQEPGGPLHYDPIPLESGFPLRMLEDKNLAVPENERMDWLGRWHPELDWLRAIHKTKYSNGLLALHEQFLRFDLPPGSPAEAGLLARFEERTRHLAESDFIVFANDHWNFNVRGFNPGGNHGSMLRISTHSVLMFAGGADTGIPRGRVIQEPYDSLSLVPTIVGMMGLDSHLPRLPGRAINELLVTPGKPPTAP